MNASKTSRVKNDIRASCREISDNAGRDIKILKEGDAEAIALRNACAVRQVHLSALEAGVYPLRYIRNREAISRQEQLRLARSRVAVAGAGGLGGQVILLLARLGIGELIVIDRDRFDETNLNRQALCVISSLGMSKARTAVDAVRTINPGVKVFPHAVSMDPQNAAELLAGSHVVVDALDNIPDRLLLNKTAESLGIPMVHGALAGFEGQLMTIYPEDGGLHLLYKDENAEHEAPEGPQDLLGVPGPTAAAVATLQTVEVLKVLLSRGVVIRNTLMHVDLETAVMNKFLLKDENASQ